MGHNTHMVALLTDLYGDVEVVLDVADVRRLVHLMIHAWLHLTNARAKSMDDQWSASQAMCVPSLRVPACLPTMSFLSASLKHWMRFSSISCNASSTTVCIPHNTTQHNTTQHTVTGVVNMNDIVRADRHRGRPPPSLCPSLPPSLPPSLTDHLVAERPTAVVERLSDTHTDAEAIRVRTYVCM